MTKIANKKLLVTAPKKNGGGSANTNSCATNKVWWVQTFECSKTATSFSCKPLGVMRAFKKFGFETVITFEKF